MKRINFLLGLVSIVILLPKLVLAYGYSVYHGFYEHPYNSTYGFQSLSSGVYHRQDNRYVSGVSSVIFAEDYGYPPVEGEDWTFDLYEADTNTWLGYVRYTYSGGCLYYDVGYGPVGLGCLADPSGVYEFYFIGTFETQCLDTQPYYHLASHSNVFAPRDNFEPTKFQPGPAVFTSDSLKSMRPKIGSSVPTTVISITVTDNLGCDKPVEFAEVNIKNTIEPFSGSHKHFWDTDEIGTGQYSYSFPPWDSSADNNTSITGLTDVEGTIESVYEAGIYGVRENVTVEVTNPDTNEVLTTIGTLDIKIPNLFPLSNSGIDYRLFGSYSSTCDVEHNDGNSIRRSHYISSRAYNGVETMARLYRTNTNGMLRFNDASLEYGGFFDSGTSNMNQACHVSHRTGIDIDVNSIDTAGRDIWFDLYAGVNGATGVLITDLDTFADASGGWRVPEGNSLHYRFNR